jgi:hypothetical protein
MRIKIEKQTEKELLDEVINTIISVVQITPCCNENNTTNKVDFHLLTNEQIREMRELYLDLPIDIKKHMFDKSSAFSKLVELWQDLI